MSFAIITSRPNFLGGRNGGRDCGSRMCRPLSAEAYSGTAKQLFHRGIAFLGSSAVLFVVGALLTGLGYYAVLTHVARALGPMCIAMAMLLVIVAARYLTISRRLTELAEMAESHEGTEEQSRNSQTPRNRGHRSTVVTIIAETDATNANQNMNETYGFRFQQADFLPPPTYDSATQDGSTGSPNAVTSGPDNIPLCEQEPPPPYTEAIKVPPPDDDVERQPDDK